jgi:2-polyprenyl-3-methyl-5-hydroxy-6-metoxy-1,4-benzoquinol methylase
VRSREQAAVQEVADISPGSLVLDAGCGDGATLEWLRTRGAMVVGVDLTLAMARLTASREFPVAVQDLEKLGLRPRFDRVLCIGVLEFVSDPARAVKNLGACLAPAGKLVLLYPRRGPLGLLYAFYHRTHGARIHLFNADEIAILFTGAGLAPPSDVRDCALSSVCSSVSVVGNT